MKNVNALAREEDPESLPGDEEGLQEAEWRSAVALRNLDNFIAYIEDTDEDEWCTDVVRSKANESQNCIFGHLVNWYYGKGYEGDVTEVWFAFEEMWATTFMIYPVNDGEDAHYTQETPKQRVLAYLRDLNDGRAQNVRQLVEEEERQMRHRQKKY